MTLYYQDEHVTLYHGDSRMETTWLDDGGVLVTDPPYGIGWSKGENRAARSRQHRGIQNDADTTVRDEALILWGDRPGVVFGSHRAPYPADVRQVLTWQKPVDAGVVGSTTGYRTDTELIFLIGKHPKRTAQRSSVFRTGGSVHGYLTTHPHSKPLGLMTALIEWTEGVVAEPFAGSGSTLIAAKMLGRKAIGVELHEPYCELIAKRLDQGVLDLGSIA